MKHLNYLLILFLIGIFIASCQKEEQVLDVELPSIEDRGSIASAQRFKLDDYRGCYNDMMTQVKRKSFEEQFGEPAKVEIIYKNTYGYSTVYPLMTDRTVTTLLWVNGINDGYFIPQNASLSKDEIAGTNITRGVSAIFNLSYTQLDPNSSVREIQKTLGDNFLVSKKRSQITIEEISEISEKANDKTIASKQIKPMCDNAELADLYFIMFGFHDESGGFPDYVFPQSVMIEAINTIINANGGYCICPIPCYLQQVLNEREDIPQEIKDQLNANMVIREFDINFTSSLSEQDFNSLASLMGRGGCSIFWECGHYDYSCVLDKVDCFNTLSSIEFQYGINVGYETVNHVIFNEPDICLMTDNEILDEVFESFSEEISTITPENSSGAANSGFHNRRLECESFNFVQQTDGAAWIACVEGLYFSKNLAGAYAFTDEFCVHFTMPRIRFDGTVIPLGMAQDCAAWAANAAAAITGFAYVENPLMTDEAIFLMFKATFNLKAKLTECGYGATTNCDAADCMGTTTNAIWTNGFFDWLDEIFFGCN